MCFKECTRLAIYATRINSHFSERRVALALPLRHLRGDRAALNRITATVFTLELRRQRLLVLLVLHCHGLGPLELLVHLVGHHAAVQHPADHGEQQQALEDPALPAGAHPVSHVGPAPLPTVCARKPVSAATNFRGNFYL